MAAVSWFANSATVAMTGMTVGVLKNVSVIPHFEVAELYGIGSVKRQDIARYGFYADVTAEVAMWAVDETLSHSWMYGAATSSDTGVSSGIRDTATNASFTVSFTLMTTSGASTMGVTVTEVVFPDLTFEGRENEFITRNLKGKGKSVTITYAAV